MCILPAKYELAICPSVLDLGSGMGQTDGQTTVISALCPHPMGAGHNNASFVVLLQ